MKSLRWYWLLNPYLAFLSPKYIVLVTSGTLKSPQVLELSGIGNKDILEKHGIKVFINSPQVGENIQDHPLTSVSFEVADDHVSGAVMRHMNIVQAVMKQYQETHDGPLSGTPLNFAYMPPVDGDSVLEPERAQSLLSESLDHVDYTPFPSQEQQYKVLRRQLLNPKDASGEFLWVLVSCLTAGLGR
jgi:choline dehydrogenase-like flavoprotein